MTFTDFINISTSALLFLLPAGLIWAFGVFCGAFFAFAWTEVEKRAPK